MADHTLTINGFDASKYKVGIVVAQFNEHITEPMLDHCVQTLKEEFFVPKNQITIARVPGAADSPAVLSAMARSRKYDALIVIGAVIKGETAHFDYVNDLVTQGVRQIQVEHAIPVTFGVLMCNTQVQAKNRIILGQEYAAAAMHTALAVESQKHPQ